MRALSELNTLAAQRYVPGIVLCVALSAPTALGHESSEDGVDWGSVEQLATAVCGKDNLKSLFFKAIKDSGEDEFHIKKFQFQCKASSAMCSSDSGCFLPPKDSPGPLPSARSQEASSLMALCGKDGVKSTSSTRAESGSGFRVDEGGIFIIDKSVTIETSIECHSSSDSGSNS